MISWLPLLLAAGVAALPTTPTPPRSLEPAGELATVAAVRLEAGAIAQTLQLVPVERAPSPSHERVPNLIIQLGDHAAHSSVIGLDRFCRGSRSVNLGVSSSFAIEWAEGSRTCPILDTSAGSASFGSVGNTGCRFDDALAAFGAPNYTRAVLSVGATDFIGAGCQMSTTELATRVAKAVHALRRSFVRTRHFSKAARLQIILPAYSMTAGPIEHCRSPNLIANLNDGLRMAAGVFRPEEVMFVDTMLEAGGSPTSFADGAYHRDTMHLNDDGECKIWTSPQMQSALGCLPAAYQCGPERAAHPTEPSVPATTFEASPSSFSPSSFSPSSISLGSSPSAPAMVSPSAPATAMTSPSSSSSASSHPHQANERHPHPVSTGTSLFEYRNDAYSEISKSMRSADRLVRGLEEVKSPAGVRKELEDMDDILKSIDAGGTSYGTSY